MIVDTEQKRKTEEESPNKRQSTRSRKKNKRIRKLPENIQQLL